MSKSFFIADTHFGHSEIMNYENRPFSSVEEMDNKIISNWNSVVSDNDKVFVLGDLSSYEKEKTAQICGSLKGIKILIRGNHDIQNESYYCDCGFESVISYPIILDNFWILSHEPLYINRNMPYANIFGHVHDNPMYKDFSRQSFCVCCERINYTPIEFDEIKSRMFSCED